MRPINAVRPRSPLVGSPFRSATKPRPPDVLVGSTHFDTFTLQQPSILRTPPRLNKLPPVVTSLGGEFYYTPIQPTVLGMSPRLRTFLPQVLVVDSEGFSEQITQPTVLALPYVAMPVPGPLVIDVMVRGLSETYWPTQPVIFKPSTVIQHRPLNVLVAGYNFPQDTISQPNILRFPGVTNVHVPIRVVVANPQFCDEKYTQPIVLRLPYRIPVPVEPILIFVDTLTATRAITEGATIVLELSDTQIVTRII